MTAQEEFDAKYISSTEICRDLGVTRASIVNARHRGVLPAPVHVRRANGDPHIMLWERVVATPYIIAWKEMLEAGRAAA